MPDHTDHPAEYRTLNGYRETENSRITPSMEDYLEMIMRMSEEGEPVRVGALARRLHVTPPSATKMVAALAEKGCVYAERYGYVTLTEYGRNTGAALVRRHTIIHDFFCMLNGTAEELTQTEKVEHFIEPHTLAAMERAIALWEQGKTPSDGSGRR